MARRVTIQDISRESGTSPSTVSRVLTGSAPVSREKREVVEQAIKRLNYRPSHLARSLKTNVTYSIGLLLNDITNPFYSAVARGVEDEASRHGYTLILCNTNEDPQREMQYLEVLQDKQVDGIVVGPTGNNVELICDIARHTPVVQIDRQLDCPDIPAVVVDNEEGGYRATRLLIEKGHRRIGIYKWRMKIATSEDRLRGYERALCEAGIPVDPSLVIEVPGLPSEQTPDLAQKSLESESPPTAIFAINNQLGLAVLDAIRKVGLRIPDDIALVVFDDLVAFHLFTPPITVIRQPAYAIGEQAMQLLLRQMKDPEHFSPEVIVLPTELIIRESA